MKKCRLCNGELHIFFDLGSIPLPEEFRTKEDLKNTINVYPLRLSYCTDCQHVQLYESVKPDLIYKQNYFYDYSVTQTGLHHWNNLAVLLKNRYQLKENDFIVDIGSNTGTLLSYFKRFKIRILGIDPFAKAVSIARKKNIETLQDYFSLKVAKKIAKKYQRAKIITCTNTFDHVDDLNEFMVGIKILLSTNGIFIIEVPYLLAMVKGLSHIPYHQQIDYFTVQPLIKFLEKYGLSIFDGEKIALHGGSIRIFISNNSNMNRSKRLTAILRDEQVFYDNFKASLKRFTTQFNNQKKAFLSLIFKLKKQGNRIAAIGASAKGITLLNFCNIGNGTIDFITEKSSLKVGRFTPSGIPIVSDRVLFEKKPDYVVLLAWNFAREILSKLKKYKDMGGRFIKPLV